MFFLYLSYENSIQYKILKYLVYNGAIKFTKCIKVMIIIIIMFYFYFLSSNLDKIIYLNNK